MKNLGRLSVLIWLAGLGACDSTLDIKPAEDYQRMLNVFSILRPGQTRQWVLLDRTMGMQENIGGIFGGRVSGAQVRIRSEGQDVLLDSSQNPGYYFTDDLQVTAGGTYSLEIIDPTDGTTVTGQTLVPGPLRITSPGRGLFPLNETITVGWTENPYSSKYVLNLKYNRGTGWTTGKYFTTSRNQLDLLPFLFAFRGDYLIEVLAVDDNYFQYTLGNTGFESTQDMLNLDGALGVFGAATADSVRIIVEEHSIFYSGEI